MKVILQSFAGQKAVGLHWGTRCKSEKGRRSSKSTASNYLLFKHLLLVNEVKRLLLVRVNGGEGNF